MIALSDIQAIMQKIILPTIQNQLFDTNVLMSKIGRNPNGMTFKNDKLYMTAETSAHSWVAFTWATGAITTGTNAFKQMEVAPKYGYGSHIIYDSTIEAAKWAPWSLTSIVDSLGKSLKTAMNRSINRQMYWDWKGTLWTITTGATSATQSVSSTFYLTEWQVLLVGTRAQVEAWTADEVTVLTINSDTAVTFSASFTSATNDIIVTKWIYVGSEYQEIIWLSALISNNVIDSGSSFQWISRATNAWTNSYVEATGAVLTEAQILSLLLNVSKYGNPDILLTTPELYLKYGSLLTANRRQVNTVELSGWFKWLEVSFGNTPVTMVMDYDCPTWNMFALSSDTWGLWELAPLSFLDNGTGWIFTPVVDTNGNRIPAFQTTMKFYGNLMGNKPRANGRLTGKTAS